jgi:hypothetical protein
VKRTKRKSDPKGEAVQGTKRAAAPAAGEAAPSRKALLIVVTVALVLRIGYIAVFHTYQFPAKDKYIFGYETGAIARSLASGHGFSSPFRGLSGPSAWLAPLYPSFVARVFGIFGIYSDRSAFVIFAFNSLLSALTCLPLFFITRYLFSDRLSGIGSDPIGS